MPKPKETIILFKDLGTVSSRKTTKEGFLSVVADFARIGIQEYYVGELPRESVPQDLRDDPYAIVRLLRPEKEVFSDESMQSFSNKSVTDGHPPEDVDASNYKDFQVGFSGQQVVKNQDRLRVPLVIQDVDVVKKVKGGKDQLSAGYSAKVIWSSGVHDSFGAYDAIQSDISGNHIAIVAKARGGKDVRINDSWSDFDKTNNKKGSKQMAVKRKIGGVTIEFSDQGAEAVDGLIQAHKDSEKDLVDAKQLLKDSKAETEKLQGKLDVEKKNQFTDKDIEKKVNERLAIIDKARALSPDVESDGKKLIDIRKDAITAVDKDFDLKDKSEEYVSAVFDTFYKKRDKKGKKSAKKAGENAGSGNGEEKSIADASRESYEKRSKEAWRHPIGWTGESKEGVQ